MATSSRQHYLPPLSVLPASIATNCGKVFAQQIELGIPLHSLSRPSSAAQLREFALFYFPLFYFIFPVRYVLTIRDAILLAEDVL